MKKITSLSLGISFLIMSYTGIMLFVTPLGRVAYWSDWHLLGLTKTQYAQLHTTSMLTMLFFAVWHIYYNWKPIVSYLKNTEKKISFTKKEFVIALLINFFFVAGTLYPVHPMKAFLQMGDAIKTSWTAQYGEPPYGHAEETKLRVFCQKEGIDLERAKRILTEQRITFHENEPLLTIAQNNHKTPNDIYQLIKQKETHSTIENLPSRLGQRTLEELSASGHIDLERSLQQLRGQGIADVTPKSKVKNIADELGVMPVDVYQMLSDQQGSGEGGH